MTKNFESDVTYLIRNLSATDVKRNLKSSSGFFMKKRATSSTKGYEAHEEEIHWRLEPAGNNRFSIWSQGLFLACTDKEGGELVDASLLNLKGSIVEKELTHWEMTNVKDNFYHVKNVGTERFLIQTETSD